MPASSSAPREPPAGPGDAASLLDALRARIGTIVAVSPWTAIDQGRIDAFAAATDDHQFIHVDPVRAAAEGPFGGTVAHGYLTLALAGALAAKALPPHPAVRAVVNMGADQVRLLAPVPAGSLLRGSYELARVAALPDGRAALRLRATLEAQGRARPVLTAELSLLLVLA
ncbi:MaoC family dehydratase [Methylobacterium sp. WSM2598]|uniref:MaoC family dehydratase n=1 Tax=Methylobacterium sp. WSM2598 TaxID=398261 RepID=UPI00035C8408|nr:MaoC family dehydratase [Methylobacterium sp. WSM2598]